MQQSYNFPQNRVQKKSLIPKNPLAIIWLLLKLIIWGVIAFITGTILRSILKI